MNHEVITNALNENEKLLIDKLEKMEAEINKKVSVKDLVSRYRKQSTDKIL